MISLELLMHPYPQVHALKHIANDNKPISDPDHTAYLWAAILDTFITRIEAV